MPTNFVFILADDLGYADLGCYGGRAPVSPIIDRMAAEGLRFTRGYANSAVCSPTRFALATGRYQYRIRWEDVKYEPGELRVVAYKGGKRWAEAVTKTTGPAARLTLKADHATIKSDGRDISFVTVTVADKDGQIVPRAKNRIHFEVSGPGEIVAVDNGDATNLESFQAPERTAYNGMCLVIIRAKAGRGGRISLKAQAKGLPTAEIPITSR